MNFPATKRFTTARVKLEFIGSRDADRQNSIAGQYWSRRPAAGTSAVENDLRDSMPVESMIIILRLDKMR